MWLAEQEWSCQVEQMLLVEQERSYQVELMLLVEQELAALALVHDA